jgi:hypothetical protein
MAAAAVEAEADERLLSELGYKQEFRRACSVRGRRSTHTGTCRDPGPFVTHKVFTKTLGTP